MKNKKPLSPARQAERDQFKQAVIDFLAALGMRKPASRLRGFKVFWSKMGDIHRAQVAVKCEFQPMNRAIRKAPDLVFEHFPNTFGHFFLLHNGGYIDLQDGGDEDPPGIIYLDLFRDKPAAIKEYPSNIL
jgi:hypothetical protein